MALFPSKAPGERSSYFLAVPVTAGVFPASDKGWPRLQNLVVGRRPPAAQMVMCLQWASVVAEGGHTGHSGNAGVLGYCKLHALAWVRAWKEMETGVLKLASWLE